VGDEAIATVGRIYDAFARRDFAAIGQLIHPDVEVVYEGIVFDANGTYRGHQGMGELLAAIVEGFDVDSFDVQVEQLFEAPDGQVVAALHQRGVGRTSGAPVEVRIAQAWTIEGGTAVRWHIFRDLAHAREALGLHD
jgi:ketosteroid isomerase-like protein